VESSRDAQRPPDHLITGPGVVDSVYQGRRKACGAGPDGAFHCKDASVVEPYAVQVDAQVVNLASYVQGPRPAYLVTSQPGGCFALQLRPHRLPTTAFGTRARLCFDPATAAPVLVEVDRPEGEDRTVATSVSGIVTDQDLRPPS